MKFSDIKVQRCYNVIFDEVRQAEFDGTHLAVVLKKNNDNKTVIVAPLTSAQNGAGYNKAYIGKINTLPSSLRTQDSYIVYNQIRTVNASRMIKLKEGSMIVDCKVNDSIFRKILKLCSLELLKPFSYENTEEFYLEMARDTRARRVIDFTYQYQKQKKKLNDYTEGTPKHTEILKEMDTLKAQILELHNYDLDYSRVYLDYDISNHIDSIIKELVE